MSTTIRKPCTAHGVRFCSRCWSQDARITASASELFELLRQCATWMSEHGCVPPCQHQALKLIARLSQEDQS